MSDSIPMAPFSDDVIFFDAEFTSLDPVHGEILSLALVKRSGAELYLELEIPAEIPIDPWVRENILPLLSGTKTPREDACEEVRAFVGDGKPYLVAYVNQFDTIFLHKLFGLNQWPFRWLPIDFASMLFTAGFDPEKLFDADKALSRSQDIPRSEQHRTHHALNDARLLRDVYGKLLGKL